MEIITFLCLLICLVLILLIVGNLMPWWCWVIVLGASVIAGIFKGIENNKKGKSKRYSGNSIQNFQAKPMEPINSWNRCTCTKEDATAILAAAEMMYKKKYNKSPEKSTCTKEHAEEILNAAQIMYQKKYNKYSKRDVYKLKEELDEDFDDFYDDLLNHIYDADNDRANEDDAFEQEILDQINYFENILPRDT